MTKRPDAGAARPYRLRELKTCGRITDRDRATCAAAKEVVEIIKRHGLTEGEMWSVLGTAGSYCVMERNTR